MLPLLILQAGDDLLLLLVDVVVVVDDDLLLLRRHLRPNLFLWGLGGQGRRRRLLARRGFAGDRLTEEVVAFENLEQDPDVVRNITEIN